MSAGRIIVADDESYVTTVVAGKLRQQGFEVLIACDGEEALALAVASPPDLVVTDYQMPVMSGYEMCVRLKQDPRTAGVPAIMLTARGHHLSPAQLAATNIRFLLSKPFSIKELLARVGDVLASLPTSGASAA